MSIREAVEHALSLSGNIAWACPDDTCILRGMVCEHIRQQGNMGIWFLHVLLLGEVVLWMMRKLENSLGRRAENFSCVRSVTQPSIPELVLAGRGVSYLRDCHNWALMVIYPCTILLDKCQMGTKGFQTRIRQWLLCDIAVGQCTQVEESLPRHCKGLLRSQDASAALSFGCRRKRPSCAKCKFHTRRQIAPAEVHVNRKHIQ